MRCAIQRASMRRTVSALSVEASRAVGISLTDHGRSGSVTCGAKRLSGFDFMAKPGITV